MGRERPGWRVGKCGHGGDGEGGEGHLQLCEIADGVSAYSTNRDIHFAEAVSFCDGGNQFRTGNIGRTSTISVHFA